MWWTHVIFSGEQMGKRLLRTQNVSERNQETFCDLDTNFVSATNVARAGQTGKHFCPPQSVRNIVSSFATTITVQGSFTAMK